LSDRKLEKIGVAWVNTGKESGKKYLKGQFKVGETIYPFIAFKNEKKENEKYPDFTFYKGDSHVQADV
jgi:uncharacterized protein (DUF736 family)